MNTMSVNKRSLKLDGVTNIDDFDTWFGILCTLNKDQLGEKGLKILKNAAPLFEEWHNHICESYDQQIEELQSDLEDTQDESTYYGLQGLVNMYQGIFDDLKEAVSEVNLEEIKDSSNKDPVKDALMELYSKVTQILEIYDGIDN